MLELGLSIRPMPPSVDRASVIQAEEEGFDIALFGDSQNLFGDPFVRLGWASSVTQTLRLLACCIPTGTRHPAVTAGAAVSVQVESDGRFVLGLGRGDSALKHLGRPYPAPLAEFQEYVRLVQAYVRGDTVDCDGFPSRLEWLPESLPRVPIEICCSGPRTIAYAAAVADRISVQVGGCVERVAWALEIVNHALAAAGRDRASVRVGAYVNVGVTDDLESAYELMRKDVAYGVSKNAMRDSPIAEQPVYLRAVTEPLRRAFLEDRDMTQFVDDEFVDWWAAVGPADKVAGRLRELAALGLDHLYLLNCQNPKLTADSRARLAGEVLPALRATTVPVTPSLAHRA